MTKIYISGAISGHSLEERRATFSKAEQFLNSKGFIAVNPMAKDLPDNAPYSEHMRMDIKLLLDCNYIFMLKGWEMSKGARLEFEVAITCGIEPMFER